MPRRVLPRRTDVVLERLLPTRSIVEGRFYDFERQQYRYVPGCRVGPFIVTNERELRKLWALIERVVVVHEAEWRDPVGMAALVAQEAQQEQEEQEEQEAAP